ncbi:PAS domain S-box protein [Halorubrum sp. HHNYT27]|uniref:sensor histidine kinase n=1 Tax=Halorubrum sp. HHNYT27 TaxID=3402275 RepID=UPI003EBC8F16
MTDRIRVLHVDDDPDLSAMTGSFLEREDDRITVETALNATAGLERLESEGIDCVVSDHDMPGPNGIEFLELVRERDSTLPFILYTGKGSETVASEAISAGVTDYLQKSGGTEQYEILANRIVDAVMKRRAEREAERIQTQLRAITDNSMDGIVTIDADSTIQFSNPAIERLFGYDPSELVGEPLSTLMADRYRRTDYESVERYLSGGNTEMDWSAVEFPGRHRDGHEVPLSVSLGGFEEDGEQRFVGIIRDVTERERHRAFVERSNDIVSLLDTNGVFQYVSPSIELILGHDPADMVGENAFAYVHPDDRERAFEAFYDSLADGTPDPIVECRLKRADGDYQWTESVGSNRLEEVGIDGYVINTRDVSDRKQREERLARLRKWTQDLNYSRSIEETTQMAVVAAADVIDAGLSGVHLLNDAGDTLEPSALGKSVAAMFDEQPTYDRDGPPGSRAALAWEAFRSDEPIIIDELSTSDRVEEETPAESLILHPIGVHGLFIISAPTPNEFSETDVLLAEILANHLKAALDRVKREMSLERLHDATRSLISADSKETIAERIVTAAREVLGFSVTTVRLYDEEAGGLVPASVSEAVKEALSDREVFTPEGDSLNWAAYEAGEVRVYDDIETVDAADNGSGLRSLMILPIGEYGSLSIGETEPGVFDDTDEFLARILATAAETAFQAEGRAERLHQRSAELERQNDRLEEFAGVISHDLRNPLNVAQGRVELARRESDSPHLEAASKAHDRMDALITDLLNLARQRNSVTETRPVDLRSIVGACWSSVETADATLVVDGDLTFRADESQLRQLIENLIRNAVEHGGESVAVEIGVLDNVAGFYVADDGPGVAPEEWSKVFDAGYSTSHEGTGLGLQIVQQIAMAHGWSVEVTEDTELGGARFEVSGIDVAERAAKN